MWQPRSFENYTNVAKQTGCPFFGKVKLCCNIFQGKNKGSTRGSKTVFATVTLSLIKLMSSSLRFRMTMSTHLLQKGDDAVEADALQQMGFLMSAWHLPFRCQWHQLTPTSQANIYYRESLTFYKEQVSLSGLWPVGLVIQLEWHILHPLLNGTFNLNKMIERHSQPCSGHFYSGLRYLFFYTCNFERMLALHLTRWIVNCLNFESKCWVVYWKTTKYKLPQPISKFRHHITNVEYEKWILILKFPKDYI